MRLLKQDVVKDLSGYMRLQADEPEDMWHAYNLIRPNDILTAPAIRKIATTSATGSTTTTRIHTSLSIRITNTNFDTPASTLHVAGRVCEENEHVKLGAHHTLDLALNRPFILTKEAGGWDSVARETVRAACDDVAKADVLAVVLQEGLAHVCAVTTSRTVLLSKIEGRVGGKGRGGEREKALRKFYERVADAVEKGWRENYKACVVAGPGWVGQALSKAMGEKDLKEIVGKVVLAHASSGHLHALSEALAGQEVEKAIGEMKESGSTKALGKFEDILRNDDGRAWYGPGEVERAIGMGAVGRGGGVLLVSDVLFRADEVGMRQKWVSLVEKVKGEGGEAFIFSSQHGSGKRLEGLGGVAAILTFPLEDLDLEEEQAETDEND